MAWSSNHASPCTRHRLASSSSRASTSSSRAAPDAAVSAKRCGTLRRIGRPRAGHARHIGEAIGLRTRGIAPARPPQPNAADRHGAVLALRDRVERAVCGEHPGRSRQAHRRHGVRAVAAARTAARAAVSAVAGVLLGRASHRMDVRLANGAASRARCRFRGAVVLGDGRRDPDAGSLRARRDAHGERASGSDRRAVVRELRQFPAQLCIRVRARDGPRAVPALPRDRASRRHARARVERGAIERVAPAALAAHAVQPAAHDPRADLVGARSRADDDGAVRRSLAALAQRQRARLLAARRRARVRAPLSRTAAAPLRRSTRVLATEAHAGAAALGAEPDPAAADRERGDVRSRKRRGANPRRRSMFPAGILTLRVSNPIVPDRARDRDGIGLRNVSERLAVHFGERARLDAGPVDATTWQATITLPALREHSGAPEHERADTR